MAAPVLSRNRDAPAARDSFVAASDLYVLTVMALMALVARVGSARLRDVVVASISAVAFRLSRRKRDVSEAMLARAFGTRLSARRRRMIVERAFREFWADVFALLPLRGHPAADVAPLVGAEHLERALAGGHGAIVLVSNHWAGMSMLKRALYVHGFPVYKVHAEHHLGGFPGGRGTWVQRRIITPFFDRHEAPIVAGMVLIRRGSLAFLREVERRLRANDIVCAAMDGRIGQRFVGRPLLGLNEAFPTGIVTLARASGAPLLPAFCLPGGGGTRIVIEPPVELPDSGDRDDVVRRAIERYAARLEHHMRRHPSRFVNWHTIGLNLPPTM